MAIAAPPPNAPTVSAPPSPPKERLHTAGDLWRLTHEGLHFELIEGALYEMIPPGGEHGGTTMDLSTYLNVHILSNMLGRCFTAETGFLLARNPDTVMAPDFAFVSTRKLSGPTPRGYVPVVPDLVLETRSPNDTKQSAEDKVGRWLRYGVRVCLEMNPPRRVLRVYRPQAADAANEAGNSLQPDAVLSASDTLVLPDILPGFSLPLRLVFRDAPSGETSPNHGDENGAD